MEFLLAIGILLLTAKLFGELMERLHLPSILGYIVAGIFLGPMHGVVSPTPEIALFGELGALLLLFVAGIKEIRLEDILRNKVATIAVSFLGYLFPFVAILFIVSHIGELFPGVSLSINQMLIMAAALSTSSIITTVKTLIDMNKLNTEGSRVLLGSSILDSFIGLFVFTLVITLATTTFVDIPKAVGITSLTLAFFLIFYLAEKALPGIISKSRFLEVEEAQFTLVFVVMLGLVYFAEIIGLNGIIGAFFAGIIISKTRLGESIFYEKIASLTYGIFVPLFFAWVGLMATPILNNFVLILVGAILAANLLGAYFGAWLGGLSEGDALLVGIGMLPRGGVDLVIIATAKSLGLLAGPAEGMLFSSVVMAIMISIVATPILLYGLFGPDKQYA